MKTLMIRGIDTELQQELEKISKKEDLSLNKTIITLLKKAVGVGKKIKYPVYDDLDHLSGTWTEKDATEFDEATAFFSKIDEDLWK